MFDNTMSLDGMANGGDPLVVRKINQDGYSSEYLLKEGPYETRLRIRHTRETAKAGKPQYDRHNVEITRSFYPTTDTPAYDVQMYFVLRNTSYSADSAAYLGPRGQADAFIGLLTDATFLGGVLGWES
jgi:hypothetical protein